MAADSHGSAVSQPSLSSRDRSDPVSIARVLYELRRRRDLLFKDHGKLFGEPAWDLLLDLYLMQKAGRRVSVSGSCIGSANSTSTALRYIGRLEHGGLVVRSRDERDGRRDWVRLTAVAEKLIEKVLGGFRDEGDDKQANANDPVGAAGLIA